ncbi:MAG TPA: MFS transporter [Kofleriaceae bacterium]|nr:MFS transporter [Kofleriaceae bacterium]
MPDRALRAARRATRAFFLVAGIGIASWAPLVPFVKARLALDEAQLGLVLLCLGVGSVASMPLVGWLSHRFGHRVTLAVSGVVLSALLPTLMLAPTTGALVVALFGFGAANGVVDVAMNAHAVEVERGFARPLMSGFHAVFSIGGLSGSAGMSALLATGVPVTTAALVIAGVLLVIVVGHVGLLLAAPPTAPVVASPAPAVRRSILHAVPATAIWLGAMCLVLFLAEGAMLDWSAVFLRTERQVAIAHAGIGYAAFSIAMAIGRLLGDRITAAFGPTRIVRTGSALAAAGLALATITPWPATAFAGFVLVGLGASNIVPVMFSAAGRIPHAPAAVSLAIVTALGYAGMLTGPAAIGGLARATSLPLALGSVALLLAGVALTAARVLRRTA